MVLGRLCGGRHHLADRRRDAVRGGRSAQRRSACSTSRPATAMRRSRPRAASPRWCRPTMSARCSSAGASARPPSGCRSRSRRRTPRTCRSRDASFDVVLSTFGVMFTPDQERAARELMRVCRPGGKIGLANWTPDSFIGKLFKTIGKYLPPPAGVKPPSLWGNKEHLQALFGAQATVATQSRQLRVPLPLAAALARDLPRLLRTGAEGLRGARRRRSAMPSRRRSMRCSMRSTRPRTARWSLRASISRS